MILDEVIIDLFQSMAASCIIHNNVGEKATADNPLYQSYLAIWKNFYKKYWMIM